ncbi:MAG: hypothetical protein MSC31_01020 [Solirubrobacteraceae bacterium MAG38_C4-C5]|nr:hypothetical protein [Candidatus Siliceabacter maunaloa]
MKATRGTPQMIDSSRRDVAWTSLSEPEADRLLKDFTEHAQRAFAFLDSLGFELTRVEGPVQQWRSAETQLRVWMKPQPNGTFLNANLALRPLKYADDPLGRRYDCHPLALAKELKGELDNNDALRYVAHRAFQLNHDGGQFVPFKPESIDRLARILREEFMPFLLNEGGALDRLAAQVGERGRVRAVEYRMRGIRPRAEEAFKSKRWQDVIDRYEPVQKHLKRSERMKLEYAQRKLEEEGR